MCGFAPLAATPLSSKGAALITLGLSAKSLFSVAGWLPLPSCWTQLSELPSLLL